MDKYRKIKVVGNGSFGHAVLVQSLYDKKQYIMKIIDVSKMDKKQKEEALNEVHVLKAMRHPYIVTYRESFMDKRCLCIVMDYADGGDMFKKIAKQKQIGQGFPERQILDWFVQISLAIKHIHDRKILHRDLKTQNVFLNGRNEVKIGDFGIARVLQNSYDCAQTAIGTPYYLSPEICQEQPYNQKSDIWSLGCILYEMITLKHAFDANSMKGLVLKILRGVYPPIPSCYSNDMRGILAEMLNKDPKKRPSVKRILEKDFLAERIQNLIPMSVVKHELGQTFINNHVHKSPSLTYEKDDNNDNSSRNSRRGLSRDNSHVSLPSSDINIGLQQRDINLDHNRNNRVLKQRSNQDLRREHSNVNSSISSNSNSNDKENITKNYEQRRQEKLDRLEKDRKYSVVPTHQEEGYQDLLSSIKDVLNKKGHKEKEEVLGNEDPKQRTFQTFLSPEGKRLEFDLDEKDSMYMRVEMLRIYLERNLGDDIFCKSYKVLIDPPYEDDSRNNKEIVKIMGETKSKFVPLIYQMIVCEDNIYHN